MTMQLSHDELQLLYRYCLALTNHNADAHDLLQSALEKWVKKTSEQTLGMGYLRRIIRNQFIDDCRRKNKIVFAEFNENITTLESTTSFEQILIDSDDIEHLLKSFNVAERETLFLSAVMGYTATEIAEQTNEPRSTILSRLHRIKKKAVVIADKSLPPQQGESK
ncbi:MULTISPECIES: RNA polymerase sigma factor [Shewanella]|jgi:RNA polymerase sigma-70 factor (ECF subfamily)|uniref:RNA polymerase sigma factor n=1 Tax=Shewanella TaxID=22 RepID=UPI001F164437|nr:sigma-70 family RNA polymerase sigma factor [Shewanella psychromarinicola]MCL1082195.1 sigma-70 family RNA polymerase sigma factor [Shewanella psychromarinicola]